ncbi:hypothetical protein [Streptomyces viridochromogenes]|uniref:hypothetical protein n=1 Tax=Streptomyces viridochromogenes TaxID=1938 RepID=UPI00030E52F7|nr:hypothetical protein [Streptomyces viridochromogenes]
MALVVALILFAAQILVTRLISRLPVRPRDPALAAEPAIAPPPRHAQPTGQGLKPEPE